jgi:5-methylcytosine-specific restriction enzyme A
MASGTVVRGTFEDDHWDEDKYRAGIPARYIEFRYDSLLNPDEDEILNTNILEEVLPQVHWHPQGSGVNIPNAYTDVLNRLWSPYASRRVSLLTDEVSPNSGLIEGALKQITVNSYERNQEARARCIQHYGTRCQVCGLDFVEKYGEIGQGYIHVHHLIPISGIGVQYTIDPIQDLQPVCPNCHAMLHRKEPPYSINDLKKIIKWDTYIVRHEATSHPPKSG